jgi:hypothetical protein
VYKQGDRGLSERAEVGRAGQGEGAHLGQELRVLCQLGAEFFVLGRGEGTHHAMVAATAAAGRPRREDGNQRPPPMICILRPVFLRLREEGL